MDDATLRTMARQSLAEARIGDGSSGDNRVRVIATKNLRRASGLGLRDALVAVDFAIASPEVRAADLPKGSVVAGQDETFLRRDTNGEFRPWQGNDGYWFNDAEVDEWLTEHGAQVLRVGDGN